MTESTLTEDIKFVDIDIFCNKHIDLCCPEILWWKKCRGIGGDLFFGDQHATWMNGHDIRKALHQPAVLKDQLLDLVFGLVHALHGLDLFFRQPKNFSKLVDR